jgi:hypothetical protein
MTVTGSTSMPALGHARGRRLVELQPRLARLLRRRPAPGQLGDDELACVADRLGRDVLERRGVGAHARDVHPALVGEGVAPDVGLAGVRRAVEQLVDDVRGRRERGQLLVGHDAVAELELQARDDRHEVRVAGALADAVHGRLHLPRARLDGGEGVGHAALGVVVAVDADPHSGVGGDDRRDHLGGGGTDLRGQGRAVGVAEHHRLGAGAGGRAQAGQRVAAVVAEAVEEVLGVVDHALALGDEERDRLGDHRQVLVARDAHDLLEVQPPRLADDRADGREGLGQRAQRRVLLGRHVAPARHPEGGDLGVGEALAGQQLEELEVLGVRAREAGLDEVDAELVQTVGDADLLAGRQRHPLPLHAVAQGRVVELDGAHCGTAAGTGSSHSR